MTPEEKQRQRDERDAAICKFYAEGHKLSETSRHFRLGKQLVLRILKKNNVWRPYERSNRTAPVNIAVSEETKQGLKELAKERGVSISHLGSEILDDYIEKENSNGDASNGTR